MAHETERKFVVFGDGWRGMVTASYQIEQAYLVAERDRSVRVRISTALTADASGDPECFLTIKIGASAAVADEFEYAIPYDHARSLFQHADKGKISKTRHIVPFEGRDWEIDCYHGEALGGHAMLDGLVVAEIESSDAMTLKSLPEWVGKEVTWDSYFRNAVLATTSLSWREHLERTGSKTEPSTTADGFVRSASGEQAE